MPNLLDELITAELVRDMVRDAERRGQVRRVLAMRRRSPVRFYSPILAGLGRWLELWGRQLQMRYGSIAKVNVITRVGGGPSGCS